MKTAYIKTKIENIINIPKIVTIHYYEFDKDFIYKGEKHDFWEILYLDKGKLEIQMDKEKIMLKQGDIAFHHPNEFHSVKAIDSAPNFFVISFVCKSPVMKQFEKLHMTLNKSFKPFISSIIKESEKTYSIPKNDTNLKQLSKLENTPLGSEQLIKTYLEQFLILIARDLIEKNSHTLFPSKESMQNHIILNVKQYITDNLKNKICIYDICDQFGFSKSYLCKLFSEQCDTSIINFVNTEKISMAKKLIRDDKMNFTQISDYLSFDNPQYFSRVFKRITKMSPTEFKNSLR